MTAYEYGFFSKCAECGVDPLELLKNAAYNAAGHALDLAEADDDAYWDSRANQLSGAGLTSGRFVGGKLVGSGKTPAATTGTAGGAQQAGVDYSGFNTWYGQGQNRSRFRNLFTDAGGNFSQADYDRFKTAHPDFFTGSDTLRNGILSKMEASNAKLGGGPYTVANSGPGYSFTGTSLDSTF